MENRAPICLGQAHVPPPLEPALTKAVKVAFPTSGMQGSPPPPGKLITQPDANHFSFPKLRWSVCHLREFLPSAACGKTASTPPCR